MIPTRIRICFVEMFRALSWGAYPYYRWRYRNLRDAKLVIGSETCHASGWIHMGMSPFGKKEVWFDYRNPFPFPFPDQSLGRVYSANLFEHLFVDELQHVLKQSRRVLKSGGVLRICVPSLEKSIDAYHRKAADFFTAMPNLNAFEDFTLGARFSRHVLVNGGHKNMFDFESLRDVLEKTGFRNIRHVEYRESSFLDRAELEALENEENHPYFRKSLFLEALK